jgi:hypothetical protein
MQVQIELTGESRDLLLNHFRERTQLHDILERAKHEEIAGVAVYTFNCDVPHAEELLRMAREHWPAAVKDIEHAISAATAH